MKEVFGMQQGHVVAVLRNYDETFVIYQESLGIETLGLGLSHLEVAVTLHNITTIEWHCGNLENDASL